MIILVTFSNDILDIHVTLSSIMHAILMKTCNEKTMSARFLVTKIQATNSLVDLLCQMSIHIYKIMWTFQPLTTIPTMALWWTFPYH
jgi:hypothetical protein